MSTVRTFLIVNADDFGLSAGVNRGIIRAHEEGIVTSTSLMVRASATAAAEAAAYARARAQLGVGLHLDLCEWRYGQGQWSPVYEVVPLNDAAALADEVDRQLEMFLRLIGRRPTHIDSHQHVHEKEPLRSVATKVAEKLKVPLRGVTRGLRYFGGFYGQNERGELAPNCITAESLLCMLARLPAGANEVGCHPGEDPDLNSPYAAERLREVIVLCDPRVREAVNGMHIELGDFRGASSLLMLR